MLDPQAWSLPLTLHSAATCPACLLATAPVSPHPPSVACSSPCVDVCGPQGLGTPQDPSIWALPPTLTATLLRLVEYGGKWGTGLYALAFPQPPWRYCTGTSGPVRHHAQPFLIWGDGCSVAWCPHEAHSERPSVCSPALHLGKPRGRFLPGVFLPHPSHLPRCSSSASSPRAFDPKKQQSVSPFPSGLLGIPLRPLVWPQGVFFLSWRKPGGGKFISRRFKNRVLVTSR